MVGIYEYTPQIHTGTCPFLKFDMRHRGLSDMVTGIDIEEKYAESDSAFKSQSCQPSVKSMDTSVISLLESGRSVISMILRSLSIVGGGGLRGGGARCGGYEGVWGVLG